MYMAEKKIMKAFFFLFGKVKMISLDRNIMIMKIVERDPVKPQNKNNPNQNDHKIKIHCTHCLKGRKITISHCSLVKVSLLVTGFVHNFG